MERVAFVYATKIATEATKQLLCLSNSAGRWPRITYAPSRCQDEVMNSSAYRFYSGALILPRRVTKWMRIVAAHRLINSARVRCLLADRGERGTRDRAF